MKILVHGDSSKSFFQLDDIREKYLADEYHTNDNIDVLSPWYCELTALHYVLKNYPDDVVGIEQYRRYLLDKNATGPIGKEEIELLLRKYDIICGYNEYTTGYIYLWPIQHGYGPCFELFLDVLREKFGQQMFLHFKEYLFGNWHCHGNLMIAKRNLLIDYMVFLNSMFRFMRPRIFNIHEYPRMIEYISEFFLGAWLTFYRKKIYFAPWMNINTAVN